MMRCEQRMEPGGPLKSISSKVPQPFECSMPGPATKVRSTRTVLVLCRAPGGFQLGGLRRRGLHWASSKLSQ